MPSSMWWPAGSWRQRSSRSVPRKSRCASGLNTPILLIQPPRLVETLTSGDVVTRRAATSGWLPRAVSSRPNVSWVETGLLVMAPASIGMGRPGRGGTGRLLSVPPTDWHSRASGDPAGKRSHSVSAVSPTSARKASIWAGESSAAWLSGSPAIGRPQPLTV